MDNGRGHDGLSCIVGRVFVLILRGWVKDNEVFVFCSGIWIDGQLKTVTSSTTGSPCLHILGGVAGLSTSSCGAAGCTLSYSTVFTTHTC